MAKTIRSQAVLESDPHGLVSEQGRICNFDKLKYDIMMTLLSVNERSICTDFPRNICQIWVTCLAHKLKHSL